MRKCVNGGCFRKKNAGASVPDAPNPGKPVKLDFKVSDPVKKAIQEANTNTDKYVKH